MVFFFYHVRDSNHGYTATVTVTATIYTVGLLITEVAGDYFDPIYVYIGRCKVVMLSE